MRKSLWACGMAAAAVLALGAAESAQAWGRGCCGFARASWGCYGYGGGYAGCYGAGYAGCYGGGYAGCYGAGYASYGYPAYGYGYASGTYYASPYTYSGYYSAASDVIYENGTEEAAEEGSGRQTATQRSPVWLDVVLPAADAQVMINGIATQQMGFERQFVSPPISSDGDYSYTIQASWMEDGEEVTRERQISVAAGQRYVVNFANGEESDQQVSQAPRNQPQRREGQITNQDQRGGAFVGRVTRVDENQIVVTDPQGNARTFRFGDNSQIMIDGRRGEINALRPGMNIRLSPNETQQGVVGRLEVTGGQGGRLEPGAPLEPQGEQPVRPGQPDLNRPNQPDPTRPGQTDPVRPGQTDPARPGQTDPARQGQTDPARQGQTEPARPNPSDRPGTGTTPQGGQGTQPAPR